MIFKMIYWSALEGPIGSTYDLGKLAYFEGGGRSSLPLRGECGLRGRQNYMPTQFIKLELIVIEHQGHALEMPGWLSDFREMLDTHHP